MFQQREPIVLADLLEHKAAFLKFEQTSLLDIKQIWKQAGEVDHDAAYLTQKKLPYDHRDPLYMKMVHRYRNCGRRPAVFCIGIDIGNQHQFLSKQLGIRNRQVSVWVDFFAWLSNMIGAYQIEPHFVELWRQLPLVYFYLSEPAQQQQFIDDYNEKEVKAYNEYFADKIQAQWFAEMATADNLNNFEQQVRQSLIAKLQEAGTELQTMNLEDDLEASD